MPDYKVNFKELKSRVGVTDVAYALGYRLDRKAGVGRYIELVLGDGREKRDTIIVSHPNDRGTQTFLRSSTNADYPMKRSDNLPHSFFSYGTDGTGILMATTSAFPIPTRIIR